MQAPAQLPLELPKASNIKDMKPSKYDIVDAKKVDTQYGETHVLKTREGNELWANNRINTFLASNRAPFTLRIKEAASFEKDGRVINYTPVECQVI